MLTRKEDLELGEAKPTKQDHNKDQQQTSVELELSE